MNKYFEWAKAGALAGFVWGLVLMLLMAIGGSAIGSMLGTSAIIGSFIGAGIGVALIIGATIMTAINFVVGRFVTNYLKFFSQKPYWRVFQVAIVGSIVMSIIFSIGSLAGLFSVYTIIAWVISALIGAWIVMNVPKMIKWKFNLT